MTFLLLAFLNILIIFFMISFYRVESIKWHLLDYTILALNVACALGNLIYFFKELPI